MCTCTLFLFENVFGLYRKADKVLEIVSDDTSSLRKHKVAYGMPDLKDPLPCFVSYSIISPLPFFPLPVSGMGFGVIAGVVAFANILKLSGGPAVVGIDDGGSQFFVLSSGQLVKGGDLNLVSDFYLVLISGLLK